MASNEQRELLGEVARIVHANAEGFFVATLRDGSTVVGTDEDARLSEGRTYRFLGRWTEHQRHGRQFAVRTFVAHVPHDARGVVRYLTEVAPGVGPARARRLWDLFGSDAVVVARTRPAEVVAAGVLTERQAVEVAEALERYAGLESTRIDLWELFDARGFPARVLIPECIHRWGTRAAERIRQNPYVLMIRRLPGCGFQRCDQLYLALGGRPHKLKRQALLAWHLLRSDTTGDTWIPAPEIVRQLTSQLGDMARPVDALRLARRGGLIAHRKDAAGNHWVTARERADHERTLAEAVARLRAHEEGVATS